MHFDNLRILIITLLIIMINGCASGSSIVTGTPRTPIDHTQVSLYSEEPDKYETIAIVKSSSDTGWTEQGSQDYAIEELKKQASKLGANGVLITTTGKNTSSIVGTKANGTTYLIPVSEQTITGKAIYISK